MQSMSNLEHLAMEALCRDTIAGDNMDLSLIQVFFFESWNSKQGLQHGRHVTTTLS
jgi:hypothetical protein